MEKDIDIKKEPESVIATRILLGSLSAAVLGLLLVTTTKSPGEGGPVAIMLFLLGIFMCALTLIAVVLRFVGKRFAMSGVRVLYTSVSLASGIVFLVGLQTLRQLQAVDLVLVLVFELLLNFYLLRRF